ncbi:MAG: glycosyltransferase [Psychroflexus halocasei]
MPFIALKYLQPTQYFRLRRQDQTYVFPKVDKLPNHILEYLSVDESYKSQEAQDYDLSWQAIQKGYIGNAETYTAFEKLPVVDEYRFIRKNFHKAWVLYVLLIRLFSFKNPFKEISAFIKTKDTKRQSFADHPVTYKAYENFDSDLIKAQPLVSVIIPTLNRYAYLKDVLEDLEKQSYQNFEVIVVDQSEPFQKDFYQSFDLDINLIYQEEKALWLARNTAIRESKGNIIMLSEDDVRIEKNWIGEHLKCLDYFNADISAGVFYPLGKSIPKERSFYAVSSQFATGNAALYKNLFNEIGLFDRQFEKQRMGDGEFGLRAYLADFKSVSNPLASCIDVKAGEGGLREMGSWDAFRPKKLFAPRPIPSVLYLFRKYFGNKAARSALLKTIPSSIMPYRYKQNSVMMLIGVLISFLFLPFVLIQVFRSWRLASIKLNEGDKIGRM